MRKTRFNHSDATLITLLVILPVGLVVTVSQFEPTPTGVTMLFVSTAFIYVLAGAS